MSVQLDWQVDDDEGTGDRQARRPAPATPPPRPARPRPWLRRLLIVVLLASATLAGALALTWRTVISRDDEALRNAVRLEARAYAENDAELFLSRQDPQDYAWRRYQAQLMEARNRWPASQPYTYTLRIVQTRIDGDLAWALLDEEQASLASSLMNGTLQPLPSAVYRRVSFYRRVPGGWLRIAPPADTTYWGENLTLTRGRYTFIYPAADQDSTRQWLETLVPAAERACADLGCSPSLRWTITLSRTIESGDSDPRAPVFENAEASTFGMVSPSLIGYPPGDVLGGQSGLALTTNLLLAALADASGRSLVNNEANREPARSYQIFGAAFFFWEWRALRPSLRASYATAQWDEAIAQSVDEPLRQAFGHGRPQEQPDYLPLARLGEAGGMTNMSYPEAYALVDYVAHTYGRDKLSALLDASLHSASAAEMLRSALGVSDVAAFERDWIEYNRQLYAR